MVQHTDWLNAIKQSILKKYNNVNPKFYVDETMLQDNPFNVWLKSIVLPPYLWLKYIKIDSDTFELKPFCPDPDDKISMKFINNFLDTINYEENKTYFTVNKYTEVYIENKNKQFGDYVVKDLPGETYYTKSEVTIELRYLLRKGYSKIILEKTSTLGDGKIIYHLHVGQDSLENMLDSGYLQLESF